MEMKNPTIKKNRENARILSVYQTSHRVRGSEAANQLKSVFCGGVYAAKNTLRGVSVAGWHSHPRRRAQRNPLIKKGITLFDELTQAG